LPASNVICVREIEQLLAVLGQHVSKKIMNQNAALRNKYFPVAGN
jgi:hypothetical protein